MIWLCFWLGCASLTLSWDLRVQIFSKLTGWVKVYFWVFPYWHQWWIVLNLIFMVFVFYWIELWCFSFVKNWVNGDWWGFHIRQDQRQNSLVLPWHLWVKGIGWEGRMGGVIENHGRDEWGCCVCWEVSEKAFRVCGVWGREEADWDRLSILRRTCYIILLVQWRSF